MIKFYENLAKTIATADHLQNDCNQLEKLVGVDSEDNFDIVNDIETNSANRFGHYSRYVPQEYDVQISEAWIAVKDDMRYSDGELSEISIAKMRKLADKISDEAAYKARTLLDFGPAFENCDGSYRTNIAEIMMSAFGKNKELAEIIKSRS